MIDGLKMFIATIYLYLHRFAVEVADFNFGETASMDMEYKTFRQRLFDSIRDFLFPHREENGSDSSLEYGPMT